MKRKKKPIKSTHCSLKFVNKGKLDQLGKFINEYRQVTEKFIDLLWPYEEMPKRLGKEFTDQIKDTWLSARAVQAAGSQASGIVRGTKEKQRKREFIYEKLLAGRPRYNNCEELWRIVMANQIKRACDICVGDRIYNQYGWCESARWVTVTRIDLREDQIIIETGTLKTYFHPQEAVAVREETCLP